MDRRKIKTTEERGMQAEQIRSQGEAALLCNASSTTPVNNSLCCAAGITALCCSATEALTPHEKLRGAATPDATLIAQIRPPAQLVEGYKPLLCTQETPKLPTVIATPLNVIQREVP